MKTVYVLFGDDVCSLYEHDGYLKALRGVKEMGYDFTVAMFHEGATNISEVLEVAKGWQEYTFITEQEFDVFLKLN